MGRTIRYREVHVCDAYSDRSLDVRPDSLLYTKFIDDGHTVVSNEWWKVDDGAFVNVPVEELVFVSLIPFAKLLLSGIANEHTFVSSFGEHKQPIGTGPVVVDGVTILGSATVDDPLTVPDNLPLIVASGTDAYTYTGPGPGEKFRLQIPNNNTGAATFNPNGTGDKPLKKNVTEDLAADDLKAGGVYIVHDDGTNYQVIGIGGSGGGGGHEIQEGGTPLATQPALNFEDDDFNLTNNTGNSSTDVAINETKWATKTYVSTQVQEASEYAEAMASYYHLTGF